NTLKAWANQNRKLAIPVFLLSGLLVLSLLTWCFWCLMDRRRRRFAVNKDKNSRPSSIASVTKLPPTAATPDIKGVVVQPSSPLDVKTDNHLPVHSIPEEAWELRPISDPSTRTSSHRYNLSEGSFPASLHPTETLDTIVTQQGSLPGTTSQYQLQKTDQLEAMNTGTHRRVKSNV
ncbi:hypothetical protein EC973_007925, partial [Apophysomyces ossiformis]